MTTQLQSALESLAAEVAHMRHLQREYSRTRNSKVLRCARQKEAEVDELLKRIKNFQDVDEFRF